MPQFFYKVAKADGTVLKNKTDAQDAETLRGQLKREGYLVFSIRKLERFAFPCLTRLFTRRELDPNEFLVFNQEFLALIRAGLPIVKTLDILIERATIPAFNEALRGIKREIQSGASIANAMTLYPDLFPPLYVSSLRAGEQSGTLSAVLERYITHLKKMNAIWKKVVQAISYPAFLLIVAGCVVFFFLIYVIPAFSEIYKNSESKIPQATHILIYAVVLLRAYSLPLLIVTGGAIAGLRAGHNTAQGKAWTSHICLRLPVIGEIMMKHALIRITRTLSTILGSGTPLVNSLMMVADAITHPEIAGKIRATINKVKEGVSLAHAFEGQGLFSPMALEMIAVGEATGTVEAFLNNIAEFYEDALDLELGRITTWVEPMLLLIMGFAVGTLVVIMYLPIFNLAETLQ